jgi:hypothetical protein
MSVVDKADVLQRAAAGECLVLELGCGDRKRHAHAIGVDALDYPGVGLVGDVFEALQKLPDACVGAVHAYHFFEHVDDLTRLLDELARVMRSDAILDIEVPSSPTRIFIPIRRTPVTSASTRSVISRTAGCFVVGCRSTAYSRNSS